MSAYWLHIIDGLLNGSGFLILGIICLLLLRHQHIGHKALLWITSAFCMGRAAASAIAVWERLPHRLSDPAAAWVHLAAGVTGLLFAAMVLASYDDIVTTLLNGESWAQERQAAFTQSCQPKVQRMVVSNERIEATSQTLVKELTERQQNPRLMERSRI